MKNKFYKDHLIRKRFGQHFLYNQHIIEKIVMKIDPKKEQAMVEIGPGLASLTKLVCKYVDQLTVIEIDRNLVKKLERNLFFKSKLIIYQQDVMITDFRKLSNKLGKPLRIFGSLPYNISSQLIFYLFKYIDVITDMNFILQKEIVDRLTAKPNKKSYGRLSIMAQYYCKAFPILEIPSKFFIPSPRVDSSMIHLIPRSEIFIPVKKISILDFITKQAFSKRRKMIKTSLGKLFNVASLISLGIDPKMRAENISVTEYCRMANHIISSVNK